MPFCEGSRVLGLEEEQVVETVVAQPTVLLGVEIRVTCAVPVRRDVNNSINTGSRSSSRGYGWWWRPGFTQMQGKSAAWYAVQGINSSMKANSRWGWWEWWLNPKCCWGRSCQGLCRVPLWKHIEQQ